MTFKEFKQKVQDPLDKQGIFTNIQHQGHKSYALIVNYKLVKVYKARISAKKRILKDYKHLLNETLSA